MKKNGQPIAQMKQNQSPKEQTSQRGSELSKIYNHPLFYIGLLAIICIVFYNKVIFGVGNFWEDLMYQEFPHRVFAHDTLSQFIFPHWNPYTFSGMPFFAAIHTGVFYITNLILSFLPIGHASLWYALELSIIFHIFASGVTMFFLAREFSLSRLGSLAAAISYMLCGFFVVHIIHSLMLYILAWMPLAMFLMKRGVEKDKPTLFIYAGLLLGGTVFAGHPQITFYEFLFLGAYALYLVLYCSKRKVKHSSLLLSIFIIAGGLGMIQLLPSSELSKESARVNWTYEMASEGSMSVRQLSTFVIPKLFGGTNSPNPWRKEMSFWLNDAYHSGYWTFWETTFYIGLAVLIFGFVQFVNVRRSRFVLLCAIWFAFSLLVALGSNGPLYEFLFKYIPGFGTFRLPARILFTWDILLPLLAARTIDELADPQMRKKYLKPLFIGGGVCLLMGLIVSSGFIKNMWMEMTNQEFSNYAAAQSNIMLLILFLTAGMTILLYRSVIKHNFYKIGMVAIIALDLFIFGMDYHIVPYSATEYFTRNRNLADYLKQENAKEQFRTKMREGGTMLLDRNQGMIDKIQLLEGYNPLNLYRHVVPTSDQRQLDLLNVKYKIVVDQNAGQVSMGYNQTLLPRAKMFYKATIAKNDSAVKQILSSNTLNYYNTLVLTQKPDISLPTIDSGSQIINNVVITKYENNRIELKVSTQENGLLWLSEIWYPAWKATIDKKPTKVMCANYSFRAVEMPKGDHTVIFTFDSAPFKTGMILTLLTMLGSILALIIFHRAERKQLKNI